jgi:hypothetical protein
MKTSKMSRRRFLGLVGGGASAVGAVALMPSSAFGVGTSQKTGSTSSATPVSTVPSVVGQVSSVDPPNITIISSDGSSTLVQVQPNAVLGRDLQVSLGDFLPGDRVCARGEWSGPILLGSSIMTIYQPVTFSIIARNGSQLDTTAGSLVLTDNTLAFSGSGAAPTPIAAYGAGDQCAALVRSQGGTQARAVMRITAA